MECRAYEYRIYPTSQQIEQFNKTLGLCRLYWNIILSEKQNNHSMLIEGYKPTFTKFKPEALNWIKEIDSDCLGQMWSDVRAAFNAFFNSCNKTRKGKFVKPPKFKSKKNPKDGFRYAVAKPKFSNKGIFLTRKLGWLKGSFHCRFAEGKIKQTTIKRTATGKWFVKITVEKKKNLKKCTNMKIIGIDWNIHNDEFCVLSNGTKIKSPMYLRRTEKHLGRHQKKMSKLYKIGKEEQSQNYLKEKQRVAIIHEKVTNKRKDFLHKLSRDLANKFQFVAVENINLQTMAQMHHGKAVGDQGFGMLRNFLAYKTNLIKVPAAYTSQTCHKCGIRNSKLTLEDREWTCPNCGSHHDRDINAAINIKMSAISRLGTYRNQNACGEPSSSTKQENLKPFVQNKKSSIKGRIFTA